MPAGTTSTTVSDLGSGLDWQVVVKAVDAAGNVSPASNTITARTESAESSTLLVNDYDGDPGWPGPNDLNNWCGAGSFSSSGVTDGALRLEYDNGGWMRSQIDTSVAEYTTLNLEVKGDSGGEESQFRLELAGSGDLLSNLTSDSIGTSFSTVSIDLTAFSFDGAPSSIYLGFWQGGSSAIEIDRIWFE
ncbi:MAG: hypothetical protein ABEJ86_03975 [Halococcoides sp.]